MTKALFQNLKIFGLIENGLSLQFIGMKTRKIAVFDWLDSVITIYLLKSIFIELRNAKLMK